MSLEVGQDVTATGNSSSMGITATGAPVAGPLLDLAPGGAGSRSGAFFFMGSCGAPVRPSPTGWAGLLLAAFVGVCLLSLGRRVASQR
ncbi:MAG: hypothetical protein ACYS47_21015 [Planctomycetota bacterium]